MELGLELESEWSLSGEEEGMVVVVHGCGVGGGVYVRCLG